MGESGESLLLYVAEVIDCLVACRLLGWIVLFVTVLLTSNSRVCHGKEDLVAVLWIGGVGEGMGMDGPMDHVPIPIDHQEGVGCRAW